LRSPERNASGFARAAALVPGDPIDLASADS
jgi:hypothetical protein